MQDNLILNIGLNGVTPLGQGYTNGRQNPELAAKVFACAQALRREGFVYFENKVVQSDSEPTWVVAVSRTPESAIPLFRNKPLYGALRGVAAALNQDVIAVYFPERGRGTMKGRTIDHDHLWGEFNPDLFFMPDGRRLSAHLAEAV